jgi:hypothetical protein
MTMNALEDGTKRRPAGALDQRSGGAWSDVGAREHACFGRAAIR